MTLEGMTPTDYSRFISTSLKAGTKDLKGPAKTEQMFHNLNQMIHTQFARISYLFSNREWIDSSKVNKKLHTEIENLTNRLNPENIHGLSKEDITSIQRQILEMKTVCGFLKENKLYINPATKLIADLDGLTTRIENLQKGLAGEKKELPRLLMGPGQEIPVEEGPRRSVTQKIKEEGAPVAEIGKKQVQAPKPQKPPKERLKERVSKREVKQEPTKSERKEEHKEVARKRESHAARPASVKIPEKAEKEHEPAKAEGKRGSKEVAHERRASVKTPETVETKHEPVAPSSRRISIGRREAEKPAEAEKREVEKPAEAEKREVEKPAEAAKGEVAKGPAAKKEAAYSLATLEIPVGAMPIGELNVIKERLQSKIGSLLTAAREWGVIHRGDEITIKSLHKDDFTDLDSSEVLELTDKMIDLVEDAYIEKFQEVPQQPGDLVEEIGTLRDELVEFSKEGSLLKRAEDKFKVVKEQLLDAKKHAYLDNKQFDRALDCEIIESKIPKALETGDQKPETLLKAAVKMNERSKFIRDQLGKLSEKPVDLLDQLRYLEGMGKKEGSELHRGALEAIKEAEKNHLEREHSILKEMKSQPQYAKNADRLDSMMRQVEELKKNVPEAKNYADCKETGNYIGKKLAEFEKEIDEMGRKVKAVEEAEKKIISRPTERRTEHEVGKVKIPEGKALKAHLEPLQKLKKKIDHDIHEIKKNLHGMLGKLIDKSKGHAYLRKLLTELSDDEVLKRGRFDSGNG